MPVFRDMPDELEEFVHFSTSCAHTLSLLTTSRLGHQVKCVRIEKTLDELIRSGIARFYLAEKKVIGELINFSRFQQPRAKKSKFPEPGREFLRTFENIREQMRASETQDDRSRTSTDRYRDRSSDLNSDPDLVTEQFEEFHEAYPSRQAKQDAEEAWRKLNPNEQLFSRILADIRHRFRTTELKFVPSPATYLRGARCNDEVITDKPKPETLIDVSKRLIHEAEVEAHGESRSTQTGSDVGSRVSGMEGNRRNPAPLRRIT